MAREHRTPFFLRFSLRTNLLLLLGCIATFLIADRVHEIVDQRDSDIADARAELLALARDGARRQADLVSEAKAILRLAAVLPEREGTSLTACQVPFRRLANDRPWLISMSVVHPNGQPLCTSADRLISQSLSDRDYFQRALATRDFVLSDYIISRLTQKPIVVAAMPRLEHGKVRAVIAASVDLNWLSRIAAETGRRMAAEVLLVDRTGTVIAAHTPSGEWIGRNIAEEPTFWTTLRAGDDVFESTAFDGKDRIIAHARLPATDAVLAVMRTRGEVLGQANREAWLALGKIIATGILCLLVVWFGGERMVTRPLGALTAGAARLGAGDLTARVETDRLSRELRVLGDTFNAMATRLGENEKELRQANLRLSELAATDGLTGLANRRRFDERMEAEWRRAFRTAEPVSLLMLDVDNFKKFNDRYGHLEGDSCLRQLAVALKAAQRRPLDLAARIGGEEFALLLPGAQMEDALTIAESIRENVAALEIEHLDGVDGHVTVSIGAVSFKPHAGQSTRMLLNAADAALYRAKRGGRNRVAIEHAAVALAS